jgi:hypothetical protein
MSNKKKEEPDDDDDQFVWNAFVVVVIIISSIIITIRHNNKQLSMIVKRQKREKTNSLFFCLYFGCGIEGGAMSCRDVRCLSDDEKNIYSSFSSFFFSSDTRIYLSIFFLSCLCSSSSISFFHIFFSLT